MALDDLPLMPKLESSLRGERRPKLAGEGCGKKVKQILATNYNRNYYPNCVNADLSREERNELDALDIVIGLSREERSYLLSVWSSRPTTPSLVRTEFRRAINVMRDIRHEGSE